MLNFRTAIILFFLLNIAKFQKNEKKLFNEESNAAILIRMRKLFLKKLKLIYIRNKKLVCKEKKL